VPFCPHDCLELKEVGESKPNGRLQESHQ
jgi:hypothetical protein